MAKNTEQQVIPKEQPVTAPSEEETLAPSEEAKVEQPSFTEEQQKLIKEQMEKAVSDAEARVQAAKDKEIANRERDWGDKLRQAELAQINNDLATQEKKELDDLGDTPEIRNFQQERRAVRQATIQKADDIRYGMAYRLGTEHGVDPKELLNAPSPEAMEAKAKSLSQTSGNTELLSELKKLSEQVARLESEREKPVQEIDNSKHVSSGKRIYTTDQIADRRFYEENRDDILAAQIEGRIKD